MKLKEIGMSLWNDFKAQMRSERGSWAVVGTILAGLGKGTVALGKGAATVGAAAGKGAAALGKGAAAAGKGAAGLAGKAGALAGKGGGKLLEAFQSMFAKGGQATKQVATVMGKPVKLGETIQGKGLGAMAKAVSRGLPKEALRAAQKDVLLGALKGGYEAFTKLAGFGGKKPEDEEEITPEAPLGIQPQPQQMPPGFRAGVAEAAPVSAPSIPERYQQYLSTKGALAVPGPQGSTLMGQGEAMPGGGVKIPEQILQKFTKQQAPPPAGQPNPFLSALLGTGRGQEGLYGVPESAFKAAIGQPMKREQRGWESYLGSLIPDVIRSKMGVQTSPQAMKQQRLAKIGEIPGNLQEKLTRYQELLPHMSDEEKMNAYQELATEFPEQALELKRIFLPSSSSPEWWEQLFPNGLPTQ